MSENPTENVVESPEPVALPTPQVSEISQAGPSAVPGQDTKAVLEVVEAALSEQRAWLEKQLRGLQSGIDKRVGPLDKLRQYLTEDQVQLIQDAQRKAVLDEVVDERLSRPESANLGKVGDNWESGVQKILGEAEKAGVKIAPDDPEVLAVSRGTYPTWPDAYAAISRVVVKRAKGVPAGAVPTEVSGTPAAALDVDALANTVTQLIASNAPTDVIVAAKQKLLEAMK